MNQHKFGIVVDDGSGWYRFLNLRKVGTGS